MHVMLYSNARAMSTIILILWKSVAFLQHRCIFTTAMSHLRNSVVFARHRCYYTTLRVRTVVCIQHRCCVITTRARLSERETSTQIVMPFIMAVVQSNTIHIMSERLRLICFCNQSSTIIKPAFQVMYRTVRCE